jgi:hypothetical protein
VVTVISVRGVTVIGAVIVLGVRHRVRSVQGVEALATQAA